MLPWSAVMTRGARRADSRARHSAEAAVDEVRRGHPRGPDPGVADHVRVRVVGDDEVPLAGLDGRDQCVCDGGGAHLGSEVVGRDVPARRNEDALLARERLLDAAVEEVRDVGVLLRLGNVQLTPAEPGQVRGQRVDGDGREADADRELVGGLVLRQRRNRQRGHRLAVERVEVAEREGLGQLTRAIGTEVQVHDRVAVGHRAARLEDGRLDELVSFAAFVGRCDGSARRTRRAGPGHERAPRMREPFGPSGCHGPWRRSDR